MTTSITFTHRDDPTLALTMGRPSEEAWAAAWDTISSARSKEAGIFAAGYNLVIATAKGIARAELPRLIDDWPTITALVIGSGAELAGTLTLTSSDPAEVNAWRFDLAATVAAAKEIESLRTKKASDIVNSTVNLEDEAASRLSALLAEHTPTLEAIAVAGLTLETCADLCARHSRKGQLIALRTRDHGVIIAKRPGFQASMAYANDSTDNGAYTASRNLVLACVLAPTNGAIASRLTDFPALTTSLASLVRAEVQGGMGAIVKKE